MRSIATLDDDDDYNDDDDKYDVIILAYMRDSIVKHPYPVEHKNQKVQKNEYEHSSKYTTRY